MDTYKVTFYKEYTKHLPMGGIERVCEDTPTVFTIDCETFQEAYDKGFDEAVKRGHNPFNYIKIEIL